MLKRHLAGTLALVLVAATGTGCKEKFAVTVIGSGAVIGGPEDAVSCSEPSCEYELSAGEEITVKAVPGADHVFGGWTGDCAGDAPDCKVTLDIPKTVSARFVKLAELTVEVVGDGTVRGDKGGLQCPDKCTAKLKPGTEVNFLRQAGNAHFSGWSGACSGRKDCVVTMAKKPLKVIATFTEPPGDVMQTVVTGAVDAKNPRVAVAFDEAQGFITVSVTGKAKITVARFDAAGKQLYSESHKVKLAKVENPPSVVVFGDEAVVGLSGGGNCELLRLAVDGRTKRWERRYTKCSGFTHLAAQGDGIFAAGVFEDETIIEDTTLRALGKNDIMVARFNFEDGQVVWASQLGGTGNEGIAGLAVEANETAHVAWRGEADVTGSWMTRLNPAGKAFPPTRFGEEGEKTPVAALHIVGDELHVLGETPGGVDFGGGKVGVRRKDGKRVQVSVAYGFDYKHVSSKLITRGRCPADAVCGFDPFGGAMRLVPGGKKSVTVERKSPEGTERWSTKVKTDGSMQPAAVLIPADGMPVVLLVATGKLSVPNGLKVEGKKPKLVALRFQD